MYELMIYSLKVGACLAVFYLFFKLLLSRETFHRFNRIVVLGAMILSFLLPLCVITVYRELPALPEIAAEATYVETPSEPLPEPFPWKTLAGAAFLAGALATLVWTFCSLAGVMRLIRRGRRERLDDGTVLVRTDEAVTPFSWGRYIVMSEADLAENGDAILLHERAHLRLRHSADLILTDLAGCLQWFNPAMWLLRRELRAIHEYEADEAVLDSGVDARSYQLLLIRKAAGGRWYSVANSFNHSKLKNRITMMLCKKSSRWAGARALLLLPLTGLALGAFARTAYVFPEDKGKKENVTVHISRTVSTRDLTKKALILVDGREVATLDSLDADRIASIRVLKDSTAVALYGERGKDGVILVSMKKEGGATSNEGSAQTWDDVRVVGFETIPREVGVTTEGPGGRQIEIEGLKGNVVRVTATDPDSMATGNRSKTAVLKTDAFAKSYKLQVDRDSKIKSNPAIIVDGVQVYEMESLDPSQIEMISVFKGERTPRKYLDSGYDGMIQITTRKGVPTREAAVNAARLSLEHARESIDSGAASIEAAREGLKHARKYMDSDAWKQAQKALDKAQKELEANREEAVSRLSEAEKALDAIPETAGSVEKVVFMEKPENSVSVAKGRVTVRGDFPEGTLFYINGKEATQADVDALKPGRIKRMAVYKGDEAVKRYGEKGRGGVVEIRARR